MSSHVELNPDDSTLGLSLGMKAMRLALTQKTHKMGTVRIPVTGGTDVIIGAGASDGANRIDQDGRQLPLVDTSGIDKAAQDAQQAADKAMAKADEAIAKGEQIRRDAQAGIDAARKQAQAVDAKADKVRTDLETAASQLESNIAAVDKKADQVRSDLTRQVQDAKSEMDSTVKAAQSAADKAQSAADAAQKAADKANADTADLDKTVQAVDAKAAAAKQAAAEAQSKAENVASDLDSANAVIEQHTTELGTLTTKVSNAVTKSDSALSVSTEAKQTATEASTTASSAYKDSQTALTQSTTATQTATAAKTTAESAGKTANESLKQSSSAVQTANQISTTLRTEYQTKADADKIYATQSSLKQTSDSITASVSKTYATKDSLSALQNVADNAIESWRGTGVPTLTNKPASDWTTDAKRKKHSGDLYYDKATGKAYRFGSDDGKTYTWELNQDTDVTKALADASKAQTSANNAQASATAANTAAGKAQSTANTAVSNAATAKHAADVAQSSANKAQGDVDKLKIDIPETYATKSSLSQTAESITANVESVKTTANSAVTAASKAQQTADGISANLTKNYQTKSQADTIYATKASLKATSDSLSANITANAKTAQSAVDKATSLEANLNGFKTTVSQTYTTKNDFNNLTIGGRNLLVKSNFIKTLIDTVNGTLEVPDAPVSDPEYNGDSSSKKPIVVDPDTTYILSAYDLMNDTGAYTGRISQFNSEGALINFIVPSIKIRDKGHITFTTDINAAYILVGIYAFPKYRWKLEKGTKPTDWSPAPEDLQPVGDYATNSSLTQTANSIKSQVTEVFKTANSAMSKATTVEQTANGLSSKITEQGKTLDATVTTANEAKSTADSNRQTISQVKTTADGAVNRVSSLEQNLDGFKSTVAKTYQTKDGMSAYATASALKQTSGSITAEVSKVSQTATGALNKATSVEQAASGLSTKITEQGKTLDATVKTANEAKSTADSNKQTISQVKSTADGAVSRVSSLEQNLSGFKTEVSGTYATKSDLDSRPSGANLWCNQPFDPDKPLIGSLASDVKAPNGANVCLIASRDHRPHSKTAFPVVPGRRYRMTAMCRRLKGNLTLRAGIWYTAMTSGQSWDTIVNPSASSDLGDGWMSCTWDFTCASGKSAGVVYFQIDQWDNNITTWWQIANVACVDVTGLQPAGDYATNSSLTQTASQIRGEVSEKYQPKSGMSSYATVSALSQKANEITGRVQEVAKTAQGNTTTISQVSQKADRINTTLSQKIDGKADTSRVSSLEQNLDGFKTGVAKTYQTKGDYPTKAEVQSRIDQSASSIKSTVGQTYTTLAATEELRKGATRTFRILGANGTGPKWVKLGYLVSNGDSSSVLLHVYSGDGYNGQPRQNAEFEIFVKDGWQQSASATSAFGVSVSRIRNADDVKVKVMAFSSCTCDIWAYLPWAYWDGHYTLHGNYESWQDGPNCGGTRIQDAEPTSGTAQDLAYDTLSTRSYVDQTSKSVALGVVQNYKGADGSGLATKSDITVAKNSITSTVAGTYATKSGVTQEISSKITQNNNSLDVKFATKTETKTAQATANTAKSNASNAQSRVGALEDCISLTSAGVRAGHQKNGVFNVVSALVNTDGSFDLLDKDGNLLTRIDRHSLQVAGDDGVGSGHLILSQDGLDITVQPTANKTATYHIRLGAGGISITAPDGSHINCSARTGLDLETVKYGKLSIGPGGLQFTNDQGWGLGLSAAGWSMKWAGNHTLATGPTAGALYIDGRQIVTR